MLDTFIDALAATSLSQWVQSTGWAIPVAQSVHILAIGAVTATSWIVCLRVFGLMRSPEPVSDAIAASFRWIYAGIVVLLLSGALLVIAEPRDILPNRMFQLKMLGLLLALALLQLYSRYVHRKSESGGTSRGSKVLATASLVLFLAIVVAGRWIAYAGT
jgi:hypothetical protein